MDFDGFRIRRISAEELNTILEKEVSEVFYGWSDSNTFQVSEIENYWWIDFEEPVETNGRSIKLGDSSPSIQDEFSVFPEEIERVLRPLIFCDWQSEMQWTDFEIPFILRMGNDLLSAPTSLPISFGGVPRQGEGDLDYDVEMDDAQTASFHSFIKDVDSILDRLRPTKREWQFLEVSVMFLTKAFVSKERRQQLLWHITALEALLGEDRPGVTNLLAKRVALILGKTKKERTRIRESFDFIYGLRSALVHGKEELFDPKARYDHFREARNLARETVVWFLRYLDHVLAKTPVECLPTREELLKVLEEVEIEKRDRLIQSNERVNHLLKILPADSPQPSSWFKNTN
jgi:hypothetical protein